MGSSHEKGTPVTPTAILIRRSKRGGRSWLLRSGEPAVVLAGLSLLVSACGGSPGRGVAQLGSTTTQSRGGPTATGKYAAALAYSRCMRVHGLLSFPDPKQVGGGIQVSGSAPGIDPQSPLFMSAQRSCRRLLPNGGQTSQAGQQRALARMLQVSQCMRAHGISGFPDPTLAPPSNRADYSAITSNGVAWLAIPNSINVRSPVFKQAAGACNLGIS
jgi:hypothetical protein